VDPLTARYPMLTPYQFASNTPIQAIDLDGLEAQIVVNDLGINSKGELFIITSSFLENNNAIENDQTFNDYANSYKYGERGTLTVNRFIDPLTINDNGVDFRIYSLESLHLSWYEYLLNLFTFGGEGGIQGGGINFTSREGSGPMESRDISLSGAESVDITELLIYVGNSNSLKMPSGFNFKNDPESLAELVNLITDIHEGVKIGIVNISDGAIQRNDSVPCGYCKGRKIPVQDKPYHTGPFGPVIKEDLK
jgi:hypothetical protein